MVNVDGLTPREAARTWMDANQEVIESWGY